MRLNWIFALWINTMLLLTCPVAKGQELPSDSRSLKTLIRNLLSGTIPVTDSLKRNFSNQTATNDSAKLKTRHQLFHVDSIQDSIEVNASRIEMHVEEISGSGVSIPGVNLPQVNVSEVSLENSVNFPGVDTQLNFPDDLSSSLDDVEGALPELPSAPVFPAIEGKNLSNLKETDNLDVGLAEADKLRRYHDPDVAKEDAMNKIKVQAVNYFAGHDEELKSALDRFSEVKSKIPEPDQVIDMFEKNNSRSDTVSFTERLVFGVTLQVQRDDAFLIGVNPSVAIKVRHRWQLGIGWNHRWVCRAESPLIRLNAQTFGLRSFAEFMLKKQLSLRAESEYLKASATMRPGSGESSEKRWIVNFNAGIKKSFRLSEKLSGNIQIMYNLSEISRQHIYANRLNARIGFDLDRILVNNRITKR